MQYSKYDIEDGKLQSHTCADCFGLAVSVGRQLSSKAVIDGFAIHYSLIASNHKTNRLILMWNSKFARRVFEIYIQARD